MVNLIAKIEKFIFMAKQNNLENYKTDLKFDKLRSEEVTINVHETRNKKKYMPLFRAPKISNVL